MTIKQVDDAGITIGEILSAASREGVVLESSRGEPRFAVLPLDDELIDYLLEHSPRLIEECQGIRERMREGRFHSHDEVKRSLGLSE